MPVSDPGLDQAGRGLYAAPEPVDDIAACRFYHAMDIPGVETTAGFDLRGREHDYLGHVSLAGRRVLEIGPASGFLTFHMEAEGADVACVELGPDAEWDVVPHAALDLDAVRAERRQVMREIRNGFWYAHRWTGSRAKVHYGDVYALPQSLGRFDIALLAAVLLHTRDPLRVVEGCARLADSIVITEQSFADLEGPRLARFHPEPGSTKWDTWWELSPDVLVRFLEVLGFGEIAVTHHEQRHIRGKDEYSIPMFSVVAHRPGAAADPGA